MPFRLCKLRYPLNFHTIAVKKNKKKTSVYCLLHPEEASWRNVDVIK